LKIVVGRNTVRVVATITEFDGVTLIDPDPDTMAVIFYDSANVNRGSATNIIHISLGVWYCDYIIPPGPRAGDWHVDWYVEKGGEPATGRGSFKMVP